MYPINLLPLREMTAEEYSNLFYHAQSVTLEQFEVFLYDDVEKDGRSYYGVFGIFRDAADGHLRYIDAYAKDYDSFAGMDLYAHSSPLDRGAFIWMMECVISEYNEFTNYSDHHKGLISYILTRFYEHQVMV